MKKKQISLNLSLTRETLKKQFGFTLFELLVSISIIGILTALASVAYSGAQKKARDARRIEDIKSIQTAAEQYYSQNNYVYPSSSVTPWAGGGINILESFPKDPKTGVNYNYTMTGGTYVAYAVVESSSNGNATSTACNIGTTGLYYCAKNQQ